MIPQLKQLISASLSSLRPVSFLLPPVQFNSSISVFFSFLIISDFLLYILFFVLFIYFFIRLWHCEDTIESIEETNLKTIFFLKNLYIYI